MILLINFCEIWLGKCGKNCINDSNVMRVIVVYWILLNGWKIL